MAQAITVKYFGPTNTKGSRFKAECDAGSMYVSYDYALNIEDNYMQAARALIRKLGWDDGRGDWFGGQTKSGVYVFVNALPHAKV